jgi:type VI secretion system secreted protein VgrG
MHTGQSIGLLAGAVQPGTEAAGKGITLIAAQGDTQIQAQSDTLQIAAKQQVSIQSETSNIDWAAAKKITLATAGGASIVIEGGNITVMCPGTITVQASSKSFSGPQRMTQAMPDFPKGTLQFPLTLKFDNTPAGTGTAWAGMPYKLYADGAQIKQGVLDDSGNLLVMHSPLVKGYRLELANGVRYDMPVVESYKNPKQGEPATGGFLKHVPGAPDPETGDTRIALSLREAYSKAFGK